MSPDTPPELFFDTPPHWLDTIRAWAESVPEVEQVWIFGSRARGVRSPKENPPPVPDLDVAYTLTGDEPGALLALSVGDGEEWRERLQAAIPVRLDLQMAAADDARVWPAVEDHGVLIYSRTPRPLAGEI